METAVLRSRVGTINVALRALQQPRATTRHIEECSSTGVLIMIQGASLNSRALGRSGIWRAISGEPAELAEPLSQRRSSRRRSSKTFWAAIARSGNKCWSFTGPREAVLTSAPQVEIEC